LLFEDRLTTVLFFFREDKRSLQTFKTVINGRVFGGCSVGKSAPNGLCYFRRKTQWRTLFTFGGTLNGSALVSRERHLSALGKLAGCLRQRADPLRWWVSVWVPGVGEGI